MSSSDVYEQRIVHAALTRMTTDRNLIKSAYQYWAANLTDKPFDVMEIVTGLNSYLGLSDAERKSLMVSMHAASNRLVDQLPPVPEFISDGSEVAVSAAQQQEKPELTTKAVSAHKVVTERYLQLVCQHVRSSDNASFRELVSIVADEGLPKLDKAIDARIKAWGNNGLDKVNFADDITPADCQDTALEFYVLLSEIIGPVESDVVVNKAIAEVINMTEAQQFNPRDLL